MRCDFFYPKNSTIPENERVNSDDFFLGLWRDAAENYAAEFIGKRSVGKKTPRGIQKFLNPVIEKRLFDDGWEGEDGRFYRGDEWLRVTFRHYTTLGSDLVDAARMSEVEGFTSVTLIAASPAFLKIVSPSDANSLCSSDGFRAQAKLNEFMLRIPLKIGSLVPVSILDDEVQALVNGAR